MSSDDVKGTQLQDADRIQCSKGAKNMSQSQQVCDG